MLHILYSSPIIVNDYKFMLAVELEVVTFLSFIFIFFFIIEYAMGRLLGVTSAEIRGRWAKN